MTRKTIDELEVLTPDQLGEILLDEVREDSPDVQFIQDLLYVGCPIDARSISNRTALHQGARYGHLEMVEFLLSKGAQLDARDVWDRTPLHWAAEWGHLEIVEFLISIGADIHARNRYGNSAFDVAAPKIKDECPELEPK